MKIREYSGKCRQCKKSFSQSVYNGYCSTNCRLEGKFQKQICLYCKKEFLTRKTKPNLCCSRICGANAKNYSLITKKIKETNLKKYGVTSGFHIPGRGLKEYLEKKGVSNSSHLKEVKEKIHLSQKSFHYNRLKELYKNEYEFLFDLNEYSQNISRHLVLKFKCLKCSQIFEDKLENGNAPRCLNCFPLYISKAQLEILEFIKSLTTEEIIHESKQIIPPKELDIYLPNRKLAIEYDGLFWHSNGSNHSSNHLLEKFIMCEEKEIKLINIFENEWLYKKPIVQSILTNILGKSKKIYARKLQIKEVSSDIARIFLDTNHIQGFVPASVYIGLFNNEQCISLMSFSKPRFSKKYEWEISRFVTVLNHSCIGGASRLFEYFIKTYKPQSIITYSDRRYFNGQIYLKLGFKFVENTRPNYFYFQKGYYTLYSRQIFQKHKLSKLLEIYDEKVTEEENMKNNGYFKIKDCGNVKYEWFSSK